MHTTAYKGTLNIGDAIQSVALARLVGRSSPAFRDELKGLNSPLYVCNGWHCREREIPENCVNTLFAGVHMKDSKPAVRWVQNSRFKMFGARDPVTLARFKKYGVDACIVGCATATLPRYDGPRHDVLYVDWPGKKHVTHAIDAQLPWRDQWNLAIGLLASYRAAKMVYTTRLHCAIPCLAFGTPVVIQYPPDKMRDAKLRFSIFDHWKVPLGVYTGKDMGRIAQNYTDFLSTQLQRTVTPSLFRDLEIPL